MKMILANNENFSRRLQMGIIVHNLSMLLQFKLLKRQIEILNEVERWMLLPMQFIKFG